MIKDRVSDERLNGLLATLPLTDTDAFCNWTIFTREVISMAEELILYRTIMPRPDNDPPP